MKPQVYLSKLKSKFPSAKIYIDNSPIFGLNYKNVPHYRGRWEGKNKREATEAGVSRHKKCICGNHSIAGHKERWKFPKYKRKNMRHKKEFATQEDEFM